MVTVTRRIQFDPQILDRLDKRQKAIEKEEKIMAVTFIKRSTLPILGRGKGATGPSVNVSEKGQIGFNPATTKAFGGLKLAVVGFDAATRNFSIQAFAKPPKNYEEADCYVLGYAKKGGGSYFSAAAILQSKELGIGYDYKASNSQSFVPTIDAEKHVVSFTLPKGALTPKPRQTRAKKTAPVVELAKAASAGVGALVEED